MGLFTFRMLLLLILGLIALAAIDRSLKSGAFGPSIKKKIEEFKLPKRESVAVQLQEINEKLEQMEERINENFVDLEARFVISFNQLEERVTLLENKEGEEQQA